MRITGFAFCAMSLLLASCTPPIDLDSKDNITEYGTVVARTQVQSVNSDGMYNKMSGNASVVSGNSGYTMAPAAVSSVTSGSLIPAGTAVLSTAGSIASAATLGLFSSSVDKSGIDYTIEKDNGETVHVIQYPNDNDDDPIFYPGQHVIIQTNGKYQKLLPPIN